MLIADGHFVVRRGIGALLANSHLHHIGFGHAHNGTRVLILTADLNVRVIPATDNSSASSSYTPPATINPAASNPAHNPHPA